MLKKCIRLFPNDKSIKERISRNKKNIDKLSIPIELYCDYNYSQDYRMQEIDLLFSNLEL